jgi:hypothetical protein
VPQETLRRVWERAEIFYRGEKAYGHQLILAALHILMDPTTPPNTTSSRSLRRRSPHGEA